VTRRHGPGARMRCGPIQALFCAFGFGVSQGVAERHLIPLISLLVGQGHHARVSKRHTLSQLSSSLVRAGAGRCARTRRRATSAAPRSGCRSTCSCCRPPRPIRRRPRLRARAGPPPARDHERQHLRRTAPRCFVRPRAGASVQCSARGRHIGRRRAAARRPERRRGGGACSDPRRGCCPWGAGRRGARGTWGGSRAYKACERRARVRACQRRGAASAGALPRSCQA